ncbi:butyrophilin subfamily 1 member A1-like [Osmerus mordax]|uniref:butyrophilin subfamily 1 member A1-like n=1 Tax=Osmerus mordax TaxID=8014 RepID=UPI003510D19A
MRRQKGKWRSCKAGKQIRKADTRARPTTYDVSYKHRTMLFKDKLVNGNVSLKLSRVKLEDEGSYTCLVIKDGQKKTTVIQLSVVVVSKPEVSIVEDREDRRVLQCVSEGWPAKPELEWRDSEGRLLPADVPQTDTHPDPGPHQRYTVTSRVTVQKTGNFTCRVQLQGHDQTRETEIHVPGEVLYNYYWFVMCRN